MKLDPGQYLDGNAWVLNSPVSLQLPYSQHRFSEPKVSLEDASKPAENLLDGQAVKRINTDDPLGYLVYLAEDSELLSHTPSYILSIFMQDLESL
jgi:hypothetical protein